VRLAMFYGASALNIPDVKLKAYGALRLAPERFHKPLTHSNGAFHHCGTTASK
jgi:hypothetical protein